MSRWIIVTVVALIAGMSSLNGTRAQTSSPVAVSCQQSPVVQSPTFPQLPQPQLAATPEASPAAALVTSVELDVASQIEAVTRSLAACLTDGNAPGVADLATADYLGDAFGGGQRLSRNDFLALAGTAPVVPIRIVSISTPVYEGMRTVNADVEFVAGYHLRLERWTYVFRTRTPADTATPVASPADPQGAWLIHRAEPLTLTAPAGSNRVEATLAEYTISLSSETVEGPNVTIAGRNDGAEPHELLVLQLQGGATIEDLLRPSADGFPPGISVLGQVSILPGGQQEMVLVGLPSGDFTVVCLFPDTSGIPHLAFGQETSLTIE